MNLFKTTTFKAASSEFTANIEMAKEAARRKEKQMESQYIDFIDSDYIKAQQAMHKSFYEMGMRHGMTRARNIFSAIFK